MGSRSGSLISDKPYDQDGNSMVSPRLTRPERRSCRLGCLQLSITFQRELSDTSPNSLVLACGQRSGICLVEGCRSRSSWLLSSDRSVSPGLTPAFASNALTLQFRKSPVAAGRAEEAANFRPNCIDPGKFVAFICQPCRRKGAQLKSVPTSRSNSSDQAA
jgi:hypothetical protein